MFGSPSFVMPGQLRNPTAQLQRLSQPLTNPSPRAAGLIKNPALAGVAKPLVPVTTPTIPNTRPGAAAIQRPMGFGTAINQRLT